MRADYVQAYINRGDVLLKMNRTEEALAVYKSALSFDAANPDIHYNLGVVALEQGRPDQGLKYLNRALELDPQHKEALLNSAIVIQELGLPHLHELAHDRLLQLKELAPDNERVFFNLGMLTMDNGKLDEAEVWFKEAITLKKDFRSALFNLALLLADQDRPLEAVAPLEQLLEHHPTHVKGLILLGDIYTNHIRDLDFAENCYLRILESEPGHVQARHNLCVVWVEKGQLAAAETCLEVRQSIHILVFFVKKLIWYCAGSPCPGSTGGLHKKAPWNCEKQTCQDKRCKRDAIVDDDTHVYDLRMIARNTIQHM